MKLTRTRRKSGTKFYMTPLIDIVLLLIIFSMVVPHLAKLRAEELDLPEARRGIDPAAEGDGRIVVNVMPGGELVVLGSQLSQSRLDKLLASQVERLGPGGVSVVIRGDRRTPWPPVAKLMRLCGARGIRRVKVAVMDPGSGGQRP